MTVTQRDRDLGTGYAMKPSTTRTELTAVGRGTPMGELLRRYWHPIGLASDATDIPRKVRALGEDLVLFRDRHARVGLLHARCCHRGTTLYYGKVEEDGIRCCYHGWKFDTEGRCLEQPCEPEGGLFKGKVRQPWYPVEKRYGLIFAYLGPAEKKPVLPRYECLENMDDGEFVEADGSSIGGGGPAIIPLQLAAAFRERRRSLSRPGAARLVLGPAIQQHDSVDAASEVRDVAARRHRAFNPASGRWQGILPGDRSRPPHAARRAQSAGRAIRPRRVDRLDAADR
nr:Rieske 2Fe-2S domain-containing protein [Bradyrhizobium sp. 157]